MMTSAIATSEPSSPALGTMRRIAPLTVAQTSLKTPEARIMAIPTNQACRAAESGSRPRALAARKAGPRIRNTAPKVLGVSRPSGMAVTARPVFLASLQAMKV